jgi:hypothetical protein
VKDELTIERHRRFREWFLKRLNSMPPDEADTARAIIFSLASIGLVDSDDKVSDKQAGTAE